MNNHHDHGGKHAGHGQPPAHLPAHLYPPGQGHRRPGGDPTLYQNTGGGGGNGAGGGAGIAFLAVGNATGVNGRAIYGIGHRPQPGGQITLLPGRFPINQTTGGGGGGGGGGGAGISFLAAGNAIGNNSPNVGPGGRPLPRMTVLPRSVPVKQNTGGGGGNGSGGGAGISFQFVGNAIGPRNYPHGAYGHAGRGTQMIILPRSLPIQQTTGGGGGGGGGGGAGISFLIGGNALWI